MSYEIYADVIFVWSLIINFAVLYMSYLILHGSINFKKILIWSILISFLSTADLILLYNQNKLAHSIVYLVIYFFMIFSFFRIRTIVGIIKLILAVFMSIITISGILDIVEERSQNIFISIFFLSIYLWALILLIRSMQKQIIYEEKLVDISLFYGDKIASGIGFLDTGNMLYDYMTDCKVVFINKALAIRLFGDSFRPYIDNYRNHKQFDYSKCIEETKLYFRPIIYKTVDNAYNEAPGIRIKGLCIRRDNLFYDDVVVAVSSYDFGGGDFEVILHQSMSKKGKENSND